MIDKIQKIYEEIEKLKSRLIHGACASQIAMETRCKEEAYNEVLAILDSMKEEPVSEDLEEASLLYYPKMSRISEPHGIIPADNESHYIGDANEDNRKAFKVGAKWKEHQMIAKAIDGKVIANGMGNPILHLWDKGKHLIDKKVKVIVFKEE